MIKFTHKGNFDKTDKFFKDGVASDYAYILEKYAREGVNLLASATPVDSGVTANSWGYEIKRYKGGTSITWTNSNTVNGIPIVILIQYGHATRDGSYIQGVDFINPTIRPLFDKITNDLWREVSNL